MSWEATAWAQKIKTGSPAAKLVLLALANFSDDEGYCFPSQKTLADITECGERSIRRYLDQLELMGAIQRVRRHRGNGTRTSDGVYLMLDLLPANLTTGQFDHRPNGLGTTGQAVAAQEYPGEQPDENKEKGRASKPDFDAATGKIINLPEAVMQKWSNAYPAIDIRKEVERAEAWLLANPKNRKSDYVRFLNGWLSRAQDKAPRAGTAASRPKPTHTGFSEKTYVGTPDNEIDWANDAVA